VSPRHLLCGFSLAALLASSAAAQEGQTVRPEVGKPLQAAVELLKGKKAREALAKAREAQAVPNKTPYESYLATRVIGQAAAAAGESGVAASAFETAAESAAAPDAEKRQFLAAAAGQYYAAKDYAKAAETSARYMRQGGTDKSVRTIYIQALYLGNNFGAAAKAIAADVEAEEGAGTRPPEEQLQLLANAYLQHRDTAGYTKALEKLVAYYPKRDYWLTLLHGVATRPGFSERLALDVARLKLETGTMRTPNEYLDAAQLALLEGFPAEAAKTIERGYAAGLLGTGTEAERHRRLKDLAAKNLAEDKKSLAQDEGKDNTTREGRALFNDGFNFVLHGRADKGLAMMQEGLRRGTGPSKRPDHARLQLAYAYHLAGQNERALQLFKAVQGGDGAAALAHLWMIRLAAASRGAGAPS
jgi:hypothetical protein